MNITNYYFNVPNKFDAENASRNKFLKLKQLE